MDVYVESNFILEFALLQEQYRSCEQILAWAEAGRVQLIVPAYSLAEPYETLTRNWKNRLRLSNDMTQEMGQLSRSKSYRKQTRSLHRIMGFLAGSIQDEKAGLQAALERILAISEIIPLHKDVFASSLNLQAVHDLSPQDAIIYASVLEHLSTHGAGLKCFLNRNSRDFDDPNIVQTLNSLNCKMLFRFDHGVDYIRSNLKRHP